MKEIFEYLTTNKDAFTVIGVLLTLTISSVSLWFSVKNNKAVHYVNSVTKNRVEWIDKLRKNIAEFISLLDTQDLTDIVLANVEQIHNIHNLTNLIADYNVDCLHITPSRLEMLLENYEFKDAFLNIKVIMIGGEELKPELVDKIFKCNKNIKIFNGYGPTETTLGISFGEINIGE